MSIDEIINVLYEHMEFNNLINNEQVEEIIKQFPECIYYGQVYRCIYIVDKVIDRDLLVSFSKSKESAKNIVYGMRGELREGKGILLRQVYEGIDLIKLLRIWKTLYEFTSDEKHRIMKLINNFREEKEIVSRLHKYEILE